MRFGWTLASAWLDSSPSEECTPLVYTAEAHTEVACNSVYDPTTLNGGGADTFPSN
jgi:hypothetical protein